MPVEHAANQTVKPALTQDNMHPSIDYLATAELLDREPSTDAYPEGRLRIVLDAVPMKALRNALHKQETKGNQAPVPFLLLEADATPHAINALLNNGGWITFTLTNDSSAEGGIPVTAITFGEQEGAALTLQLTRSMSATLQLVQSASVLWPTFLGTPKISDIHVDTRGGSTDFSIGVYDVGQASFGAVVDEYEHPVAYLDMGWPLTFNRHSLPKLPNFRLFNSPEPDEAPVILSHLDWDHWSYAIQHGFARFDENLLAWITSPHYRPEAIQRPWYMREPKYVQHNLGPSHANLVHTLASTTTPSGKPVLHVYDEALPSMKIGPITLIRCDAPSGGNSAAFLRNNEGLAVLLTTREDVKILVCGDADYVSIPISFCSQLSGIVAPHHGGSITCSSMPFPAISNAKMVVSVGNGCYSSVPDPATNSKALANGWDWIETTNRANCPHGGCTRGHKAIYLGGKPQCSCSRVPTACLCLD